MAEESARLGLHMTKWDSLIVRVLSAVALALLVGLAGCTSRAVTVTSLPPGAEVSINRRVVGKTPVRVNYTHYGSYRIELRKDRYQTLVREEKLRPPWYGYDPFAFMADNVIPARINDESYLHYVMVEVPEMGDRDALMGRANMARDGKAIHPVTQSEVDVAWASTATEGTVTDLDAPRKPDQETAEAPAIVGPSPTPQLTLPSELKAPKGITEKPPEATPDTIPPTTPATGTKPVPDTKTGTAKVPAKPPPAPLPEGKQMVRTPKGEILIYDTPTIEDPGKK